MNQPGRHPGKDTSVKGDGGREPPVLATGATGHAQTAEELRQSEGKLHLLVSSIKDCAIFMLDPTGYVVSWNAGAQRLEGYAEEEILGKYFGIFYTPEDAASGKPARGLAIAEREGHYEDEGWRVRKDGTRFWADMVITALRDADDQLVGFGKVTRDLTERRRAAEERFSLVQEREARNAAKQAIFLRDEFLSIAAHELKTPVTSLRLQAQVLIRRLDKTDAIDPEKLRHALDLVVRQSGKISDLVNKLLDASRITNGRLALDRQETDVVSLTTHIVDTIPSVRLSPSIVVDAPERLVAMVDPLRLEQVVTNLLDNAIKHSPNGPIVVTVCRREPASLEISVRDNGPGIPLDRRDHIFDRIHQADPRDNTTGLGLGLRISQEIVRLHGGEIRVESPADGGARFVVSLPIDDEDDRDARSVAPPGSADRH